jgi:bifunctional DNA-binding transcriptional regulator/antitoxin component of YhaV-PrlF toxin-antitoxin module
MGMRTSVGTSVGERGQITIEKEIRERLGVRPKDIAVQQIEDGRLVVTFVKPYEPHMRSVAGVLGPPPRLPDPGKSWNELVEVAAAAEYVAEQRRARGEDADDDD